MAYMINHMQGGTEIKRQLPTTLYRHQKTRQWTYCFRNRMKPALCDLQGVDSLGGRLWNFLGGLLPGSPATGLGWPPVLG